MSLNLIDPVNEILQKVKEATGKDVRLIEKNDLSTYAALKIARRNMPSHLIFYKAEHDEEINHLIAHECGHVLRMFGVPAEKRVIPYTDDQIKLKALTQIEPEIQKLSSVLPFNKLAQIVNLWYDGIVKQVTNFPPDIMIEKWIYGEYPKLRPYQSRCINKQHKDAVAGLSMEVANMTPRKILDASNIMNYAFFRIIGMHFGVNYVRSYNSSPYFDRGKKLAKITENYVDSYEGDIEMVKKWADFLGLSGWFTWTDFENVPKNYQEIL